MVRGRAAKTQLAWGHGPGAFVIFCAFVAIFGGCGEAQKSVKPHGVTSRQKLVERFVRAGRADDLRLLKRLVHPRCLEALENKASGLVKAHLGPTLNNKELPKKGEKRRTIQWGPPREMRHEVAGTHWAVAPSKLFKVVWSSPTGRDTTEIGADVIEEEGRWYIVVPVPK